ncbi:YwdI family protein [Oceanobacillus jeddahense]|uniref:YwdI family protein n=1 Tax=Oceanobacillus jeddahense TaxID=1462527 RepID=A0ABY5JQS9_9BACI|nr:YwdI family protein [Oceanobacillus jeddahense]UUI02675.1 YwdI family protein [Oceanobacillus jeddahense]
MAISNEIIINKMIRELEEAKRIAHQQDQVKKHMENIHLLSELFISASPESNIVNQMQVNIEDTEEQISEAEMKAMLGKQSSGKVVTPEKNKLNENDANGESLFDF